jgi:tRNA(fMet)-specific endonuclease VapC
VERRRGLLDTSVVILVWRLSYDALPDVGYVSTITLAELAVGPRVATSPAERASREEHVRFTRDNFTALPFDEASAEAFGEIAGALRLAGKTAHARAFDTLIAAVARAHRLPLYTCNPSDFQRIDGLGVIAVPVPDS